MKTHILLLIFLPLSCFAQFNITGRVLNQTDSKPVADASVFLSNATIGSKTTADGYFILNNVKPGKYELTVSSIGFETYSTTVIVTGRNIALPDIRLSQKIISLNEVSIKAVNDPNKERNYNWFKNEFLGTSYFSGECKILNPHVLDIVYDDKKSVLTASSADFLEIENEALGYKIKYLLTSFTMDNSNESGKKIHFEGSVLFEQMKGASSQEQKWQKRRELVYEGSIMHFLRSAIKDSINEEGFNVMRYKTNPDVHKPGRLTGFPLIKQDLVMPTNQQGVYALGCDFDTLYITYDKKHRVNKNGINKPVYKLGDADATIVSFNSPYVLFDNNGGIINPNSLSLNGIWGKNRLAELLPVDYEPPATINNSNIIILQTQTQPNGLGSSKDSLSKIIIASDSLIKSRPPEKLYLQFDKPYYAVGDTIWFKGYLFNAPTMGLSAKSGIMYVDIANDSSSFVKHYRLPVNEGFSWGNISLSDFPAGNYTVSAYTTWMRNFGADCFFYKKFMVADDHKQTWLANSEATYSVVNNKLQADVKLLLSDMDKTAIVNTALLLQVMTGNHHLYKQEVQTDGKGMLDVNFTVPDKATGLKLIAEDKQGGNKITIPINLNRAEHADVQFLPEGGSLVAGLKSHIGFKAIGEDGRGINISGIVTDQNQQQVAAFQYIYKGMGSFNLTANRGETYTAKINLPGGGIKEYPLPIVKSKGTVLSVMNPADKDSLTVSISATNDIAQSGESYFLMGKSRGIVCYAAVLNFKGGTITRKIAKQLFPSGITHFILMNTKGQPLNERLIFIDHRDNLNIKLSTDKETYAPHDSIAVHITVSDSTGTPVAGNFSMAVTDDAHVKPDTANNETIITRLLLTDELKGYVEEPGYYFQTKNAQFPQALDNLLLTQGWVSYDWQADKEHPVFVAEHELEVRGQVQNGFNKSVKATRVTLLSKSPLFAKDTLTDNDGRFVFRNFPDIDTPVFFIKAVNRHDKSFNVGIVMDDEKPPVLTRPALPEMQPWYLGSDTGLLNTAKNNRIRNQEKYIDPQSHLLKEVKITGKKVVKGSQNLNGPGNADLVLDEKDMIEAAKKTMLDMLQEKIKGFHTGNIRSYFARFFVQDKSFGDVISATMATVRNSYPGNNFPWYFVEDKPVKFIVDGIPFGVNSKIPDLGSPDINEITTFLLYHNAEDIIGIELNSTTKYSGDYFRRYLPADWPLEWKNALSAFDFAFIEITTRSGKGPELSNTSGMYLYKPLSLIQPKQFYKPQYTVNDTIKRLSDFRSTIDWEPNVISDKNGNATVSFFAADKQGGYTIIIEGTDGNGNLGYKMGKINIGKTNGKAK